MKVIVDSNIIFSALLSKDNTSRMILFSPNIEFFSCNLMMVEIFKNKEKIARISNLSDDEILVQLAKILTRINFVNEEIIPKTIFRAAYDLCNNIDENDTPFVALTVFLDGYLLTGDKKLIEGLKSKGFERILSLTDILNYT
ncbi:DNA-binding protein [Candidatus Poribacteria bacterium]|nr:DNA-binding protein [Candidatus Poribacteria bacterium]